jgi:hypothetical protein
MPSATKNLKPSVRPKPPLPKQKKVRRHSSDCDAAIAEATQNFLRVLHKVPPLPPEPGKIRLIVVPWHRVNRTDPFFIALSKDRTRREWSALLEEWRAQKLPTGVETTPFYFHGILRNPFMNKHLYAAALERILADEWKARWWARKWVARVRARIYFRKRCVGAEEDLFTCQPVPAFQAVRIIDYASKSAYVFHTATALKMLLSGLHYSHYGIACPTTPKNPYTNLPWKYGQLMSLVAQIGANLWNAHRPMPIELLKYREAGYNIQTFLTKNRRYLVIRAAESFFKEKTTNPDARDIYEELMRDMYDTLWADEEPADAARVRRSVIQHRLSPALQEQWDRCVIAAWIYENHSFLHADFTSYDQLLGTFLVLHTMTVDSLRRQVTVAGPALPTVNQLLVAATVSQ